MVIRGTSDRKIESYPALIQSIWLTEEEFLEQFKPRILCNSRCIIIHDKGFLR